MSPLMRDYKFPEYWNSASYTAPVYILERTPILRDTTRQQHSYIFSRTNDCTVRWHLYEEQGGGLNGSFTDHQSSCVLL